MRIDFIRGVNDLHFFSITQARMIPNVAFLDEEVGEYGVFRLKDGKPVTPPGILVIPYKKLGIEVRLIHPAPEYRIL